MATDDELDDEWWLPSNDSVEFLNGNLLTVPMPMNMDDTRDEKLAAIEIGILGVILCAAIVGNSFVLIALWRQIHFSPRSRMYLFMLHLSIADLLVAFFSVLPQMIWKITFRFKGGHFLCKAVKYMQVMVLYLSTYILMMMAIDRYRAICWTTSWHHWNSLKLAKWLVAVAWLLSLTFAIPQALLFNIVQLHPTNPISMETMSEIKPIIVSDCWVQFNDPWNAKVYVTWFVTSAFIVPLIVLTYCYGVITFRIWTYDPSNPAVTMKPRSSNVHQQQRTSQITYAKLKTIKLTFIVVLCFFACWSPFCVTQLIMVYNPQNKAGPVETIFVLLACLNSCTNPWIYLAFSGSLVNHLRVCLGIGTRRARDNGSIGDDEPEPQRQRQPQLESRPEPVVSRRKVQELSKVHESDVGANTTHTIGVGNRQRHLPINIHPKINKDKIVFNKDQIGDDDVDDYNEDDGNCNSGKLQSTKSDIV